jgi:hypothetical protein
MMTRLGLGLLFAAISLVGCGSGAESSNELVIARCSSDQPFCQKFQGRSWTNMNESMTYDAAEKYCASLGGRLPTISELRTLVVDCETTKAGGTCGITDTCSSGVTCWDTQACQNCGDGGHSVFHDDEHAWSSTPFGEATKGGYWLDVKPGSRWNLTFRYSEIEPMDPNYPIRSYCLKP